uniref:Uncharacterized protein n=1 Tax=Anopheles farauti TaxID=69004 RepID=A0A499FUR7_9DIPT
MQTPNAENSIPVMELNTLCQTKHGEDAKAKSVQEGALVFPSLPYFHNTSDTRYESIRRTYETVPATHLTRNYRGNTTHFPMGVYENEVPTKSHCYSSYGRMRPYFIPHRTRTKSESSDPTNLSLSREPSGHAGVNSASVSLTGTAVSSTLMETCEHAGAIVDTPMNAAGSSGTRCKNPVVVLKKSRSLENVRVDNSVEGSQHSHEMEFVSSRIQKLKVQEEM